MTDAVLAVPTRDPIDGLGRLRIDGRELDDVLDHDSWLSLSATVTAMIDDAAIPSSRLVLFTTDGRTWDAELAVAQGRVTLQLHDVSRHVDEADRFARLALQLHRRNRDLEVLHDAGTRLGATLDVSALVDATAELVAEYLGAHRVLATAAGYESAVGDVNGTDPAAPWRRPP